MKKYIISNFIKLDSSWVKGNFLVNYLLHLKSNMQSLFEYYLNYFRKVLSHAKIQPSVPLGSLGLCLWPSRRLLPTRWIMLAVKGCNWCFCCIAFLWWKFTKIYIMKLLKVIVSQLSYAFPLLLWEFFSRCSQYILNLGVFKNLHVL